MFAALPSPKKRAQTLRPQEQEEAVAPSNMPPDGLHVRLVSPSAHSTRAPPKREPEQELQLLRQRPIGVEADGVGEAREP